VTGVTTGRAIAHNRPICDGHHIVKVTPAVGLRESVMPASSLSSEASGVRRGISVWRHFFTRLLVEPTRKAEDELAEYLERHQHDLPPALRIELERRSMSL
jgi:hypothetical protein